VKSYIRTVNIKLDRKSKHHTKEVHMWKLYELILIGNASSAETLLCTAFHVLKGGQLFIEHSSPQC